MILIKTDYEEASASLENATPSSQASTSTGSQADRDKNSLRMVMKKYRLNVKLF
jgi:hypothetical protein